MRQAPDRLVGLVERVVGPMGYELVGVQLQGRGAAGMLLRVFIDHADGITLDDCAAVSHQLSGALDVEDPIRERYTLEVSSPGLDRPLFTLADYERFAGHRAKLRLARLADGRRNFAGVLRGASGGRIRIEVDGQVLEFPHGDVESARLVPEF
ncbi:MAG: ribosome maturation factor RimP [Gammaproteobacteria bacterium]|jgi:ribosome maturation factor RimP|nr:ribosome maturation factor RimP [Gammaproteobacteria bacterium]